MYKLKSIAQRGSLLGAAAAIVAAVILPAASVFADSLNPLTERSLQLSSSAPGYTDTDGSGNSEGAPNAVGGNFAPAGSGPNGKKTGETFSFKVSTDSTPAGVNKPIKAFTLQYCTNAAGLCQAPGNNEGDARTGATIARKDNETSWPDKKSDLDVVGTFTQGTGPGQFQVYNHNVADTSTWTMTAINAEDPAHSGALSGKNNLIRLTSSTGISPQTLDPIKIVFNASTNNYITNPGAGSFFVKINTYDSDTVTNLIPAMPSTTNTHIIDGGVTVANVMTDSIHITTKVLETMSFSVGTVNRDAMVVDCDDPGANTDPNAGPVCESTTAVHGTCDPIKTVNNNRLNLGDPDSEYSLQTTKAWDVNSFWRLSSNSSGGATVYYSGNTLANTVGDEIAEIGATKAASTPGTEQFGLAFVDAGLDTRDAALNTLIAAPNSRFKVPESFPFRTLSSQTTGKYDAATLPAQPTSAQYNAGTGTLDDGAGHPGTASFAFQKSSLTSPVPIAQENEQVISCATAKMRYVGNIGADTPAGVYTTKINYLAAPQY
jgi:hypothetical protein